MDNRILVKFVATYDYIDIRTVTRKRKSPWSITATRNDFIILERDGHVIVRSMFSFAEFQRNENSNTVTIYFTWLNNHGYQYVGWTQTVVLPYDELMDFALDKRGNRVWNILSIEPQNCPRFVFECPKQLRKCIENRLIRRKLVRFLRENFKWWGVEKICFYNDFTPYSFDFRGFRNGTPGITGGLIYHAGEDLSKGYYCIHT